MKKHYIFKATGVDTSRHNKKRTEFRHGVCSSIEEAELCAAYYRGICFEAGWDKVKVDVFTVTEMKHVATIKGGIKYMTPDQKRDALAVACLNTPGSECNAAVFNGDESCPVCGVCTYFADTSDETACELYAEAVKRGAIKEEQ